MRKIKNLIFIFESFLTKFDYERYRFDYYESKGLKVKILNISPITRKKYYEGEKEKYDNIKDIQKTCFSFKDLEKEVLENENIENWNNYVKNDFEKYVFSKIKILNKIKSHLIDRGAKFVSLSGSGSCIYGIFEKNNLPEKEFQFDYHYLQFL